MKKRIVFFVSVILVCAFSACNGTKPANETTDKITDETTDTGIWQEYYPPNNTGKFDSTIRVQVIKGGKNLVDYSVVVHNAQASENLSQHWINVDTGDEVYRHLGEWYWDIKYDGHTHMSGGGARDGHYDVAFSCGGSCSSAAGRLLATLQNGYDENGKYIGGNSDGIDFIYIIRYRE
jgi:hypothetical protein